MNKPNLNDYEDEGQEFIKMFQPKSKVVTRSISHKEYYYPFEGEITNFDDYRDLVEILLTANPGDYVRLYISSNGGRIDVSTQIVDRIMEARQREVIVIAELGFNVASAATYIALSCDDLNVSPHTQWCIHPWSSGAGWGFAQNHLMDAIFNKKQSDRFMRETYEGFLTSTELDSVLEYPRDLSFDAEEVVQRWGNMQQYREEQFHKMMEEMKAEQEAKLNPPAQPKKKSTKAK